MKILVTTGHLDNFSGSKQWVYTVTKELSKLHKVVVTAPRLGAMAEKIRENIKWVVVVHMDELLRVASENDFDLGVISQVQSAPILRSKLCKTTIYVSHGLGQADKPLWDCGVVVGLSDEINKRWGIKHLSYNPIDAEWYNCPKKVLYLSEHGGLLDKLKEVCKELGYELRHARKTWYIRDAIHWADIVVSVGRGVLEAMSCGKRVIIADYRKYNGQPLMDYGYNVSHNCSGRCDRIDPTVDMLRETLLGSVGRDTILRYHDVSKVCQKLLGLAESETKKKSSSEL